MAAVMLSSCASNREVITTCLQDTIIMASREASATGGVEKMKFTTTVTTTVAGDVEVTVPLSVATGVLGLSTTRATGNTLEMEVDVKSAAKGKLSGRAFKCFPRSGIAREIAPPAGWPKSGS